MTKGECQELVDAYVVSIGAQKGPRIGVQKGPPPATERGLSR